MDINVTLRFTDSGSGQAVKALQSITGAAEKGGAAAQKTADAQSKAAQGADNLARSGKAAAQATGEVARAAAQLDRANAAGLDRGLKNVTTSAQKAGQAVKTLGGNIKSAMQGMAQVATGVAAAGGTLYMAAKKPMDTELRFARMADTAAPATATLEDRKALAQQYRAGAVNAVREGRGTLDGVMEAQQALVGYGGMSMADINKALPVIQKYASSSGTKSLDIANIVITLLKTGKSAPEGLEKSLGILLASAKQGNFEMNELAAYIPETLSPAKDLEGPAGLARYGASMQIAKSSTGSASTAANNVRNLYENVNSPRLKEAFRRKHDTNLTGTLAKAREKGMFTVDAVVELMEGIVKKDKKHQQLLARAEKETDPEKKQNLLAAAKIRKQSIVGDVFTDQEARTQLIAEMDYKQRAQQIKKESLQADGVVDKDFERYKSTTYASTEALANETAITSLDVLDKASPTIKKATDTVSEAARNNPNAAIILSGLGVVAATALASGAAFNVAGKFFGGAAGAVPGAAAATSGKAMPRAMKGVGALSLGWEGYQAWLTETNPDLTRAEKNKAHSVQASGWAGAVTGGKAGATWGAPYGPYGAIIGGLVGAGAGYVFGEELAKLIHGKPEKESKDGFSRGDLNSIFSELRGIKPEANVTVMLDGREVAAHVAERLGYDFRRGGN